MTAIRTATTDRGTPVGIIGVPGSATMSVTLVIASGITAEEPGAHGIAHLVEHLLHETARHDGVTVEETVSAHGGMSNAQTHPLHTEFTFVIPAPDDIAAVRRWIDIAESRLAEPDWDDVDVAREARIVGVEIAHRLATPGVVGFPWADALGALGTDHALSHNGFTDLSGLAGADAATTLHFARRAVTQRAAITVAGPWDAAEATAVVADLHRPQTSSRPIDLLDGYEITPRVHRVHHRAIGFGTAAIRRVGRDGDPGVDRARLTMAVGVLDAIDPTATWQTGLFGSDLGFDHHIVIGTRRSRDGLPSLPTLPTDAHLRAPGLTETTRAALLRSAEMITTSTVAAGALAARDLLAGIDTARWQRALSEVSAYDVASTIARIAATPAGVLERSGGARTPATGQRIAVPA